MLLTNTEKVIRHGAKNVMKYSINYGLLICIVMRLDIGSKLRNFGLSEGDSNKMTKTYNLFIINQNRNTILS
jgi:hypothetical protein